MTQARDIANWLPLSRGGRVAPGEPTGEAFRTEWIDFQRGIRVGNLEPHERITQILKHHLQLRYATPFITDRWGRGVYWQWICWLPRANRQAKPLSSAFNFGCAKLFIAADRQAQVFQSGLQIERGYLSRSSPYPGNNLAEDWDWNRLIAASRKDGPLDKELRRLVLEEGFVAEIGDFQKNLVLDRSSFRSAAQLRSAGRRIPGGGWGGFQLYYPMPAKEVRACSGYELVKAILGAFVETVPLMNLCMQVPLVDTHYVAKTRL
jgi:hypothetical protein